MEESMIVPYTACAVAALSALHSRGWIYRDVKAENFVFTTGGLLKLVDLGLARQLPADTHCSTICGSCEYMAPEVIRQVRGH